jgi:outer membrane lipoprotein SlyB
MRNTFLSLSALSLVASGIAVPTAADARHRYYGHSRVYHHDCRRSKGTTGTIVGGVGGALIGNAIGGDALGTIVGGVGGALLGRHLDRRHDAAQNRRDGC